MEFFKASGFRAAFEDKGRFKDFLQDIPVYMITHPQPGLLGLVPIYAKNWGMSCQANRIVFIVGAEEYLPGG